MPTFSIITVCYNEAAHIRETLDSVVSQTCKDYEWIVVDGGSTDGTKEILEQYADHFSWWCSEPDKGIYNGMNKGVKHATGEYVIFMNGGDIFHNEHVLEAISLAGLDTDVIEGLAVRMDNGETLRHHDPDLAHKLLTDGISHQSAFTRRELLVKYPYDERYKIVADWKFWLQTLLRDRCSFKFLDIIVADTDMTGVTYNHFSQNLQERTQVLEELKSDEVLGLLAGVFQEYDYLTHNTLVQYATFLDQHSPKGYQLARKIVKRIFKVVKYKS